jgi:sugar transferase (PEP-CTERM system associated)
MLGFTTSMVLWFGMLDADLVLWYEQGFLKIIVVSAVFILCMYYFDLYDTLVLGNRREALTRLVQVLGTSCVILAALYVAYPTIRMSYSVFWSGLLIVGISVGLLRRLFLFLNHMPHFSERALIIGDGVLTEALFSEVVNRKELGVQLVGCVSDGHEVAGVAKVPRLGRVDQLEELIRREQVKRVIVAMAERRGRLPIEALLKLKTQGVKVQDGAEFYESVTGKLSLESLRLSWLLFSPGFQISRALSVYKRAISILLALFGILVTFPAMVVVAICIRLDSKGPIIFRQPRVGKNGKIFVLYKFRSMKENADKGGFNAPAEEGDRRITRVGAYLRRLRLDELPQLFNILFGDMYFVGPRPFVPDQEEHLVKQIAFYSQRWSVRPGATGWAQVNRGYCATLEDNADKLAHDLFYIKNMSIGLDLLILFKTAKIILLGRGGR